MTFEQGGPAETDPIDDDDVSSDQDEDLDLDDEANDKALDDLVSAVTAGAADLEKFGSTELDRDLTNQFVTATKTASTNTSEVVRDTQGQSRLDVIQDRLNRALQGVLPDVAAYREFFQSLFGFEVPPKCDPTKVLMQLSDILGSTQNSGATAAITEISTQFKAMPDAAYWSALAAAYDGERCPTDELGKHLVFMGVTSEITAPPKDTFYWPHANANHLKLIN